MTLGERIKAARLKKGYSQAELAELLGYKSRSSINKIEVEGRDIPRSSIVKFAKVLDVTPSYLMGWEQSTDGLDSVDDTNAEEPTEKPSTIKEEDIKFALFNGSDGITDEMYDEVKQFAEMVKLREETKRKNK